MTGLSEQSNPIERLFAIADKLRCDAQGIELGEWLCAALEMHLRESIPLDRALGLSGRLGRSPAFRYHYCCRRSHLLNALSHCDGDYILLAAEAERFEKRVWPMYRDKSSPPADWSPLRASLHAAFRVGIGVPTTAPGLRKALQN